MDARAQLMDSIRTGFARTEAWTGLREPVPEVMEVMSRVPRDRFVPAERRDKAWEDRALGIGYGATISQPFIVALMTSLVDPQPDHRVLEIGAGCGYQSAILAELSKHVFSLEIVPELRHACAGRLREFGYDNVDVRHGDGWYGIPEEAPFDAIVVTACARRIPGKLRKQLAAGGRMVVPIGEEGMHQDLLLLEKDADGKAHKHLVLPVSFVPMVGRGR